MTFCLSQAITGWDSDWCGNHHICSIHVISEAENLISVDLQDLTRLVNNLRGISDWCGNHSGSNWCGITLPVNTQTLLRDAILSE